MKKVAIEFLNWLKKVAEFFGFVKERPSPLPEVPKKLIEVSSFVEMCRIELDELNEGDMISVLANGNTYVYHDGGFERIPLPEEVDADTRLFTGLDDQI